MVSSGRRRSPPYLDHMGGDETQPSIHEAPALPVLLTPADVAEFLRVPRRTVYEWIDSGQLPSHRVGTRLLRIFREDVLALLQRVAVSGELGADTPSVDRMEQSGAEG